MNPLIRPLARAITTALIGAAALQIASASPLSAQRPSQRGQPQTPFGTTDFAKARWLEGRWAGTSQGENSVYEQIHFVDDSTAEIHYYRDPGFAQEVGTGRLYLSVGRIYHTFGPNRWGASHVGADGIYFVPQSNTRTDFNWSFQSPDAWTSTMRSGVGGHERVTVYQMTRVK